MTAPIHEELARHRKAARLAALLRKSGCDRDTCLRLHPQDWLDLARGADVKPPSTLTVQIVADMLDEEGDPFEGLDAPVGSRL